MVAWLTWTFWSDVKEELDDDNDHVNEIDEEFDKARGENRKKYNYNKKGSWFMAFKMNFVRLCQKWC